jgi:hypothetical protein
MSVVSIEQHATVIGLSNQQWSTKLNDMSLSEFVPIFFNLDR